MPAMCSGDLVFASGQAQVDEQGRIVSGTFAEEARRLMENLRRVLATAVWVGDVVRVRHLRGP